MFVAVEVLPLSPTAALLPRACGGPRCSDLRLQIIQQWGLDQPLVNRYAIFLSNVLSGNLGVSLTVRLGTPVWDLIAPAIPVTLLLLGITLALEAILAIGLGSPLSRRRRSLVDTVVSVLLSLPFAATVPVMGLLGLYVFGFALRLVPLVPPVGGYGLDYYVLPMVLLVGSVAGLFTWMIRDHPFRPPSRPAVIPGDWRAPTANSDPWFRVAVARFLSALPALTGWTLGAVLLTEMVWNINGLGLLLWMGLTRFDPFVVTGTVLVAGLLVVLPILVVADVLHEWLTMSWTRQDGTSTAELRVEGRDLLQGLRRILDSGMGFAGLTLIILLVGMAAAAPWLAGPYPTFATAAIPNLPPSGAHLFGTDSAGRDIAALVLYGGTPGLAAALFAFALALVAELGVLAATGLLGPRADVFVAIPLDAALVLSVPFVLLLAGMVAPAAAVLLPGLVGWPVAARILQLETRGLVPSRTRFYARRPGSRGERTLDLIWGAGPLLLGDALLAVSLALTIWATLGFLGLGSAGGAQIEGWGQIINNAYYNLAMLRGQWWWLIPPSICIFTAVLAPLLLALAVKNLPLARRPAVRTPTDGPPAVQIPTAVPPPGP